MTIASPPAPALRRPLLLALFLAMATAGWLISRPPPSFEAQILQFLRDERISGAAAAYGLIGAPPTLLAFGEAAPGRPMKPEDRFRLASLAKPITAAATLRLIEEGRLSLDDPAPEAGPGITIRHLLQHSGGWDRTISFDPLFDHRRAAAMGVAPPYRCEDLLKIAPPAEFAPGERYAYTNNGYCALGAIVGRLAERPYEDYVRREILEPRGAQGLVYDGAPSVVHPSPWPSYVYAALGPGGGWTGTVEDYWRFAAGPLDPRATERPSYAQEGREYYGLGWRVWPDGALSHFGAIHGAYSLVLRRDDQVAVLAFNGRPQNDDLAFARLRAALAQLGI